MREQKEREQKEREQAGRLRAWQQTVEDAGQTNRLGGEVVGDVRVACRPG
ncbi:hypothetical protein L5G33_07590 [Gordonia sp. HY366]|uniref:Uncharacterized protein n=1 Tax=Gordonia liuliyuniae TaxID=2911517 RepID=A0ABS9IRY5_9ACTN|nr:hypothetical protein [Gordonia liuliyuniae]